jgi:group I intron endonuclease
MGRRIRLTGIYCITCICNNKKYIGSSIDLTIRWNSHITSLMFNKHSNKGLQADFNKFGLVNFTFNILVVANKNITKEQLLGLEQLEIDAIHKGNSYNTKRAIAKKGVNLKVK